MKSSFFVRILKDSAIDSSGMSDVRLTVILPLSSISRLKSGTTTEEARSMRSPPANCAPGLGLSERISSSAFRRRPVSRPEAERSMSRRRRLYRS